MKKFIVSLLIVGLTLTACEKTYVNSNGTISFGNTTTNVVTRATANVGPNNCGYNQFNVFSEEAGMNPYLVQWDGNAWTYDGIGTQTEQHFDKSYDAYNFIAVISDKTGSYASSTVTVQDVEAFLTNDETNTPKEFLWAGNTVARANYSNQVSLAFAHGNAKMYIGFASDRNDTQVIDYVPGSPAIPAHTDTTGVYFNIKKTTNVILTASNYDSSNPIPQALIDEIKSYYSVDGGAAGDYDIKAMSSGVHTLKVVKDIPANYATNYDMGNSGKLFTFFNAVKYLNDNGYSLTLNKPEVINYILLEGYVNGTAYTIAGFDYGLSSGTTNSKPQYETVDVPAQPAVPGIDGIRTFAVDASGSPIVRTTHTVKADANITTTANTFVNPTLVDEVITFDKPTATVVQIADKTSITLDTDVTMSPSVWYAVPISNTAYVVKFSYIYNGVTKYDARILIPAASSNFGQSEYYKYVIYITDSTGGSTNPSAATDDKDEVDTAELPIIFNNITFGTYHGNLIVI